MLFFILTVGSDRKIYCYSLWAEKPAGDAELEDLADQARGLSMREGRIYHAMWGFCVPDDRMAEFERIHREYGETFRKSCLSEFAYGFQDAYYDRRQQPHIERNMEEMIAAEPYVLKILLLARTYGYQRGREEKLL